MAGEYKGRRDDYKKRKKYQHKVFNQFYSDWQDRQRHCLSSLIYASPVFNRDIEMLRKDVSRDITQKAAYITRKYAEFGIRPYALPMIAHYIERNKVNAFFMYDVVYSAKTEDADAPPANRDLDQ